MNKVVMIGRLTKDVALNTTGVKPVGKFTIAVTEISRIKMESMMQIL